MPCFFFKPAPSWQPCGALSHFPRQTWRVGKRVTCDKGYGSGDRHMTWTFRLLGSGAGQRGQPGCDGGRHRGRGDRDGGGLTDGRDPRPERHRGPTAEWVRFLSDCSLLQSDEEKGQCLALQPWLSNHSWHLNMWTGRLTPQQTSAQRLQPPNKKPAASQFQ